MKWIHFFVRLYIKGSVHVALAVTSMVYITERIAQSPFSKSLYTAVFFGSIVSYNFIKYGLEAKRYVIRSKQLMIPVMVLSVVGGMLAIYTGISLTYDQYKILGVLMGFLLLYTVPLWPLKSNLRNYSGLKIYIVAAVWTGVTVILPLAEHPFEHLIALSLSRFIFVIVLMLPFEIRDLKYDDPDLQTIPQQLGVLKTKWLGGLLTFLWVLLEIFMSFHSWWMTLIIALLLGCALYFSDTDNRRSYTVFWVEALPIFYAILLAYFF